MGAVAAIGRSVGRQFERNVDEDWYKDFDWKAPPGQCQEPVFCYAFAKSPTGDGTDCVISDPLDKYLTKDQLWDMLMYWRMHPWKDDTVLDLKIETDKDGTIVIKRKLDMEKVGPIAERDRGVVQKVDTADPIRITKLEISLDELLMSRVHYYGDERTMSTARDFLRVHSDPLLVEAWRVEPLGARQADEHLRRFMEGILNRIVKMEQEPMLDMDALDAIASANEDFWVMCW